MGLDLLAAGGGAADGLQQLLADQITQARLDEEKRHNQAAEGLQARTLDQNDQYRRDTLAATTQNRRDTQIEKQVASRGIGDPVSEGEYANETNSGIPTGLYKINPGAQVQSMTGYSTMPGDLNPSAAMTTSTDKTSNMNAPRSITFQGTGAERAAAQKETDAQDRSAATLQQHIDDAQAKAEQAWERMRMQGQTQDAMNAFHQSQIELATLRQQLEASKASEAAAKTPQPQFFRDAQGNWHAGIFDKGAMKEIPLPSGFTPTKAAPESTWDRISSFFGGSKSGPADPTDPNWGR